MKFKNDIEKYEFFELVLNRSVSRKAGEEFERALRDNPELALEFKEYEELHELVLDDSILHVKETLQYVHEKAINSNFRNHRGWSGNRFILTILSGMLVISGILFFRHRSHDREDAYANGNDSRSQVIMDSVIYKNKRKTYPTPGSQSGEPLDSYLIVQPKILRKVEKEVESKGNLSVTAKKDTFPEKKVDTISEISKKESTALITPKLTDDTMAMLLPENKPESAALHESDAKITDCSEVHIKYNYEKTNSCVEYVSGEIRILEQTLTGGTPPYYVSIDGGYEYFPSSHVFNRLNPGEYRLIIKDVNQCQEEAKNIVLEEKICQTEYKYSPLKGDPWVIPFEKEKTGVFRLFSSSGQILVEKYLDPYLDKSWYGNDDNGMPLQMGYYPFIIRYDDGEIFRGSVTLVK